MAKKAAKKKPLRKKLTKSAKYVRAKVERFPIEELEAAPYNPRTITDVALKGLESSLTQFGLLAPPIVNISDGKRRIVGGHQRVKAAVASGATEIDCIVVTMDEATERRANLTLNNPAIEGEFVPELTTKVIARISELVGDEGVKALSDLRLDALIKLVQKSVHHRPGIDDEVKHGKSDDDYIPSLLKSGAVSKPNEMYACGDHLLYCGRITSVGTLDIFNEVTATTSFTRLVSKEEFNPTFLDAHVGHVLENTSGAIYLATNTDRIAEVTRTFLALGGHWSNMLIGFNPSQKPSNQFAYRDVTIPILYGWKAGNTHPFYGDRTQGNAWHLKSAPPKRDIPVEAVVRHILNSSRKGESVLDAQCATGSTLIACEKTGRRLLGYVQSPRDMDLIRRRWTRFVHGPDANWKTETGLAT